MVIPTDTVYGIAADPRRPDAIKAIFALKGRPSDKPLPVLAASTSDLARVGLVEGPALKLAQRFWPGPLTIVVQRSMDFDHDLGGDPDDRTVAVRIPENPIALELLRSVGPLAVTSANLSNHPPARTIAEAMAAFGDSVTVYLDGGECDGEVSTVVRVVNEVEVLRVGALSAEELAQVAQSAPGV